MKLKIIIAIVIALYYSVSLSVQAEGIPSEDNSYAEEYGDLRRLLQRVQNRESALTYKSQIANELAKLKSSQISGGQEFDSLSSKEKKLFIKKFQNNQFHCGEVTQVMEERRRILLDPDLSQVLSSLMNEIP